MPVIIVRFGVGSVSVMVSRVSRRLEGSDEGGTCRGVDNRLASCRWLLDQDIAQVEHLAGLDGELLAEPGTGPSPIVLS